ncbi:hypothetical protein DB346_19640 [Verrucomicrobia bacterium LW23]|nr:hypothetical protein DB346_19640 [Verrucomicrobia bacterium LW23]
MICMIYRRKRAVGGKVELARLYRGRYRLEGEAKIKDVALNTSDKRIAQQNLEKIVKDKQLEVAGSATQHGSSSADAAPQGLHR